MLIILIIIGAAFLIVMYFVMIYNKLVKLKVLCEEGWSAIDVFLKKRYDLIPNLLETVKGYAKHESETFENIVKARNNAINASTVKEKEISEQQLNGALKGLNIVVEQYPDLKASTNFQQLSAELSKIESEIESSRRYYNATARDLNIAVTTFPSVIVANMFNFEKKDFFEIATQERENPKVTF
ncbi:LemA family protein [uncultured Flavobacterium sp.]|uniref:LemA family protein n=1 Tax=uncultured Flavobacterium sp. TaxID=165435 RepID=UPI0030EF33D9|tara:strand:+ start:50674 stop:51225 length:552 start_codon:yes stop_codon:yes gene_type:complete